MSSEFSLVEISTEGASVTKYYFNEEKWEPYMKIYQLTQFVNYIFEIKIYVFQNLICDSAKYATKGLKEKNQNFLFSNSILLHWAQTC